MLKHSLERRLRQLMQLTARETYQFSEACIAGLVNSQGAPNKAIMACLFVQEPEPGEEDGACTADCVREVVSGMLCDCGR